MAARGWARLPLCSGLCLCAGCMVDHLVWGSPVFAVGLGDRGLPDGKEITDGDLVVGSARDFAGRWSGDRAVAAAGRP